LVEALLDEDKPFPPRFLHRLSDLNPADATRLAEAWPQIAVWRRQNLLEDLYELSEADTVLSFEAVGRLGLQDSDARVRLLSIQVLEDYEFTELVPTYIRMVETDPDAEVRARAASALGQYVYLGETEEMSVKLLHTVEECLLQVISGKDAPLVRRRALEALGYSSREDVPPLIETAYASKKKDWLVTALFAMGRSGNEVWRPKVLRMLTSNWPAVRAEAASASGELGLQEAVPQLMELLNDDEEDVHSAAIWALSQTGGERVRQVLEDLLENAEDDEDAEFLDEALENLALTEDMQLFSVLDLADEDLEDNPVGDNRVEDDDEDSTR
jgi:HEAT repeat protein